MLLNYENCIFDQFSKSYHPEFFFYLVAVEKLTSFLKRITCLWKACRDITKSKNQLLQNFGNLNNSMQCNESFLLSFFPLKFVISYEIIYKKCLFIRYQCMKVIEANIIILFQGNRLMGRLHLFQFFLCIKFKYVSFDK